MSGGGAFHQKKKPPLLWPGTVTVAAGAAAAKGVGLGSLVDIPRKAETPKAAS